MSSITPNTNDQEIDLGQVSKKIGQAYEGFLSWVFRGFLFVKRNLIVLIILFIIGAGLGYYLDKNTKVYDHEMIVIPNFGSAEYVYSKVNLLNSKLMEDDKPFLKSIGIKDFKLVSNVEIEPINDIYTFVNSREQNFELVKLMAEDGDINKIIEDETTSINYKSHKIKITTSRTATKEEFIKPILNYLNDSEYYKEVQVSMVESVKKIINSQENTINQIDSLLNSFSKSAKGSSNNNLVYYNENTQLNDVLKTKTDLINDITFRKLDIINNTSIVKESSTVLNVKNYKGLNGKRKLVFPILFISLFLVLGLVRNFYRKQKLKAI